MALKGSYYNLFYDIKGKKYIVNTMNCAMAEIDDDFMRIVNNPNGAFIESDSKLMELSRAMQDNGFLVDERISEIDLLKFEHFKTQFSKDELSLTIAPTMACNFACPYCFENKDGSVMNDATATALVKFVDEHLQGVKKMRVVWFGGEPLLAKERIWSLSEQFIKITAAHDVEYSAYIVSNTYCVDADVIENMKLYKITGIQSTVDGLADFHNKRRFLKTKPFEDTFTVILKNVRQLVDHDINVNLRINVDKTNVDQVEPLINYLVDKGLGKVKISIGQVLPITSICDGIADTCLTTEEFSDWTNLYYKILQKNGFEVFDKYPFYPVPRCNYCGADSINSFYIVPNGDIFKCWDEIEDNPVGNVFKGVGSNIEDEYNLSKWICNDFLDDEECQKCKYLPICAGGCPHLRRKKGTRNCDKWKWGLEGTVANMVE